MKNPTIVCAIVTLSMSVSGVAFGQNDKDVRADEANRREHLPLRQQQQLDRQDRARAQPGRHEGRDDHRPPGHADRGRGAGPDHNFYRGGRLPPQYRERSYVVDDWRGHHLQRPPRGYHWVQTGPDYVLVAITTGIIASILLGQ